LKVLTVRQPYASAIAIGKKKIEYRTWNTPYRGKLAIHVSSSYPRENKNQGAEEPYATWLRPIIEQNGSLPLGQVIAVVDLVDILIVNRKNAARIEQLNEGLRIPADYDYAWVLENPRMLETPITVKGKLNLWELPELDEN